ncbi:MAG: hypothetical protein N3A72_00410 [bacterium]|nr:hypothetical protein [bacterium]
MAAERSKSGFKPLLFSSARKTNLKNQVTETLAMKGVVLMQRCRQKINSIRYANIFLFILVAMFFSVCSSFSAMTLVGYINGEKIGSGVAPNDRVGSIMLTTDRCDLNWGEIILRGATPFTENWQKYQSLFPDNWTVAAGNQMFYRLVGEKNRFLNVFPENSYTRLVYTPGAIQGKGGQVAQFSPPYELTVQVEATGANVSGYRLRMGIGAPSADRVGSLQCYQIAIHENVINIRDRQDERVFEKPYQFPLGPVTLRLLVRKPIPVRFTDVNQETVETIGIKGCYITVEDRNANSDASTHQQVTVKVTTATGDEEQFSLPETWKNSSVFQNTNVIQVVAGNPIPGNGILEGTNGEAVTVSYGSKNAEAKIAF